MKKIILTSTFILSVLISQSQVVIDTVSIGIGYTNQVWYSLQNDEQGTAPKNNWDIAFSASGQGASVLINSVIGTTLWLYPATDTSGWSTLDTTGINAWTARYNSDTSWALGAFNQPLSTNPFDMGWGIYNNITHFVTGDSLYVIKLSSGAYKKIWIQQLASGVYSFKYADLNGSNLQNATITKSAYTGKNFAYYSLQTNAALDREPLSTNWDLLFSQYTAFIPTPYTVSGVLSNKGVTVADVRGVANPTTYNNWSIHPYLTPINEIGYDWKAFSGVWTIEDSLVYFVKSKPGDIWKIIFTGFGGSTNGNYIFSKEKLSSVGITDVIDKKTIASMAIFPNPVNSGDDVTLIYNFESTISKASVRIYDMTGKNIFSDVLTNHQQGLYTYNISTANIISGMYFISIEADNQSMQQKLIIK